MNLAGFPELGRVWGLLSSQRILGEALAEQFYDEIVANVSDVADDITPKICKSSVFLCGCATRPSTPAKCRAQGRFG